MKRPSALHRETRMRILFFTLAGALTLAACATSVGATEDRAATAAPEASAGLERASTTPQQSSDSYYTSASASVAQRAGDDFAPKAKNIILFIGDGMGVSTVTAGRIYAGQQKGLDGESYRLAMESLPWSAFSKTYSHDSQVADSASTATAMLSGVKTRSRTLGLRSGVSYGNCASQDGQGTDSLFEIAEAAGGQHAPGALDQGALLGGGGDPGHGAVSGLWGMGPRVLRMPRRQPLTPKQPIATGKMMPKSGTAAARTSPVSSSTGRPVTDLKSFLVVAVVLSCPLV